LLCCLLLATCGLLQVLLPIAACVACVARVAVAIAAAAAADAIGVPLPPYSEAKFIGRCVDTLCLFRMFFQFLCFVWAHFPAIFVKKVLLGSRTLFWQWFGEPEFY